MKTDKLLRVLTKNAPNRSGRALPLPKYQGVNQSQPGQSLKKQVPEDLVKRYDELQTAIQSMLNTPEYYGGMNPVEVRDFGLKHQARDFIEQYPTMDKNCVGPYCATVASSLFYLTHGDKAPSPVTGGDTWREKVLQNPEFGSTSEDIYKEVKPGSVLQVQAYKRVKLPSGEMSEPAWRSSHNMYVYDVGKEKEDGKRKVYTIQSGGGDNIFTKDYLIDEEGNIYYDDGTYAHDSGRKVRNPVEGDHRPVVIYPKGAYSDPKFNDLLKQRTELQKQISEIDSEYFMPKKPTRYDVDYQPGQFVLPQNFSSEEGKIVPNKNYKEFIDLRESRVPEIVNQINDPEYKKMIMREYNISDAEYNAAVKTMMGQYMMESQGGTDWQSGFKIPEHRFFANLMPKSWVWNKSLGPFQINYSSLGEKTKKLYPSDEREALDFMYDPVKSSDIAMRYLAENVRTLRNLSKQEGERQNMTPENYLDFLPYVISQPGWLRRTDEESRSKKGSILGEGVNRYIQGIKDYGDRLLDYIPMMSDAMITNPPGIEVEKLSKKKGGGISASKAKEILRDGSVHGQPLTDKQKRYFGWIAGGKKQDGGSSTIDTTRSHAYVESPCGPGYIESTDANGNPICINPDTFNQQNSARIDAQRAAQAAIMPADNNPSGNPSVSWDVNRDGPYPKNWYNNGPEDDLTSTFMSDCPECEQNSRGLNRRYRRMMRKNNPQQPVSNPIEIPEFTMPRLGIGRFFKNAIKNCRPGERCYTFEDGGPLGQYQGEQSQTGRSAINKDSYWIDLPLGISVANIFDKQFWQDEWERHELGNLFGDSFRSPWEPQSTKDRLKELKKLKKQGGESLEKYQTARQVNLYQTALNQANSFFQPSSTAVIPIISGKQQDELFQKRQDVERLSDEAFEKKHGMGKHRYMYETDPAYKATVDKDIRAKEAAGMPMIKKTVEVNPNLMFMAPNATDAEQAQNVIDYNLLVQGAMLPIPGLQAVGKVPGIFDAASGLIAASKESGLLSNAWRLNPKAYQYNLPSNTMWRGIGREGMEDAVQSGVFRARQLNYPEKRSLAQIVNSPKQFRSAYFTPKFNTAATYGDNFIAEVPRDAAQWRQRYGRTDWSQIADRDIPISEGRILQKDWWGGYKEVPIGPLHGPSWPLSQADEAANKINWYKNVIYNPQGQFKRVENDLNQWIRNQKEMMDFARIEDAKNTINLGYDELLGKKPLTVDDINLIAGTEREKGLHNITLLEKLRQETPDILKRKYEAIRQLQMSKIDLSKLSKREKFLYKQSTGLGDELFEPGFLDNYINSRPNFATIEKEIKKAAEASGIPYFFPNQQNTIFRESLGSKIKVPPSMLSPEAKAQQAANLPFTTSGTGKAWELRNAIDELDFIIKSEKYNPSGKYSAEQLNALKTQRAGLTQDLEMHRIKTHNRLFNDPDMPWFANKYGGSKLPVNKKTGGSTKTLKVRIKKPK